MAETIERIENLMRSKKMSPAKVAKAAGIDKSTLSNILNGRRANPSPSTLEGIAGALGTTLDYLRGNTENPQPVNGEPMPDFGLDVLEAMRRLPRARNYELLVIAQSFIDHQAEIDAISREQLKDLLLDVGEKVFGEAAVDELLQRLSALEDRGAAGNANGSVKSRRSLPGHAEQPNEDSA